MRSAWQYTALPAHASELRSRVAFAWRAMDAFYEEDDRIVGHASDPYHRIDIRQSSRRLVVRDGTRLIADITRPVVLYESGFAPRWYVRVSNLVSFEPDKIDVFLDDKKLALAPGQSVMERGIDRGLDPDEILGQDNSSRS